MLAPAHRQAAEDIEATIASIVGQPQAARVVIQESWAAVFHWIAYGTQTKHGQHHDHHSHMGSYLRQLGEPAMANRWETMDHLRQGAMYGQQAHPAAVSEAQRILGDIRTWATS